MGEVDYGESLQGYDQVEEAPVLDDSALAAGWYPLEIVKILNKGVSKQEVPYVRMQARVFDGPSRGRNTFLMISLTESPVKRRDGLEFKRTVGERAEARATQQGNMKRLLRSMGVNTGAALGVGPEQVFSFYNVDSWEGRQLMARLKLDNERPDGKGGNYPPGNSLSSTTTLDDKKHGLGVYLADGGGVAKPASSGAVRL